MASLDPESKDFSAHYSNSLKLANQWHFWVIWGYLFYVTFTVHLHRQMFYDNINCLCNCWDHPEG